MNQLITCTLVSIWVLLTGGNAIDHSHWAVTNSLISVVNCEGETLSILKKDGAELKAMSLISLVNGNMLIGGSEDSASLLVELNPDGNVIWAGTVDVLSGHSEAFTSLTQDSEGKIICLGRGGNANLDSYFVKFDPISRSLEWTTLSANADHVFYDVVIQGGFDPYIVSGLIRYAPSPGLGGDACLRSIDRTTGEFTTDLLNNYNLGSAEHFSSVKLYNGYLYAIGRYNSAGGGFAKMRIAVSKLDMNGNEIWTQLLIQPEDISARVYGGDLTFKNGYLYFIGNGDPNGTSTAITKSYLGRMDLNGNLIWAREFDFDGISKQVFSSISTTPDGLLISCADGVAGGKRAFLHVDENGDILSSGQLGDIIDFATGRDDFLVMESNFYAIYSTSQYSGESAIAFIRHPLNAITSDGCLDFGEFIVTSKDITAPANESYDLIEYSQSSTYSSSFLTFVETGISDTLECVCQEICDNFIDDDGDGLTDCEDPDLEDNCCCLTVGDSTVTIEYPDTITASIGETVLLNPVITSDNGIESYLWTPATDLSCVTCPDPTAIIRRSTVYSLEVTDSIGCVYARQFVILLVSDCGSAVYIPNIFSPNNDGVNDLFFVQGLSNIDRFVRLKVFDRWGGVVFETNDPYSKWDGQYNGKEASAGVYIYTLEVICHDGNQVILSGDITLIK